MVLIEIHPLSAVKLKDAGKLWSFQRRKVMPVPVDIVVLRPDLPRILQPQKRDKKERSIFAALHATLGGIDYICRLASLSDDQIESATMSGYTADQIHSWLLAGHEMFPYLKDVPMAMASTQLELAIEKKDRIRVVRPDSVPPVLGSY